MIRAYLKLSESAQLRALWNQQHGVARSPTNGFRSIQFFLRGFAIFVDVHCLNMDVSPFSDLKLEIGETPTLEAAEVAWDMEFLEFVTHLLFALKHIFVTGTISTAL